MLIVRAENHSHVHCSLVKQTLMGYKIVGSLLWATVRIHMLRVWRKRTGRRSCWITRQALDLVTLHKTGQKNSLWGLCKWKGECWAFMLPIQPVPCHSLPCSRGCKCGNGLLSIEECPREPLSWGFLFSNTSQEIWCSQWHFKDYLNCCSTFIF